jgi:hypothetical protein
MAGCSFRRFGRFSRFYLYGNLETSRFSRDDVLGATSPTRQEPESRLGHLKQSPVDHLTIDQTIIPGRAENADDKAVVAAVIHAQGRIAMRLQVGFRSAAGRAACTAQESDADKRETARREGGRKLCFTCTWSDHALT